MRIICLAGVENARWCKRLTVCKLSIMFLLLKSLSSKPVAEAQKVRSWVGPDTFFEGKLPSPRQGHTLTSTGDGILFLFGGWGNSGKIAEDLIANKSNRSCIHLPHPNCLVKYYSFNNYLWNDTMMDLEKNSAVYFNLLQTIADTGLLNDLHMYDPHNISWSDLTVTLTDPWPSPRDGHGFTSTGGKLYVHGGYGTDGAWVISNTQTHPHRSDPEHN